MDVDNGDVIIVDETIVTVVTVSDDDDDDDDNDQQVTHDARLARQKIIKSLCDQTNRIIKKALSTVPQCSRYEQFVLSLRRKPHPVTPPTNDENEDNTS